MVTLFRPHGCVASIRYPITQDADNIGVVWVSPSGQIYREWRSLCDVQIREVDQLQWSAAYKAITERSISEVRALFAHN